eukprot:TRINITY_DN1667_c0_g5_i1.p1 TRINITY_DN1667_c0_g5~~TRINITY_DN1667_c0_g5_i1.p1  ORF type:complete len:402 (+),score=56.38 TRINITY_DN1667_c0_g5_i1:86-1291(+)
MSNKIKDIKPKDVFVSVPSNLNPTQKPCIITTQDDLTKLINKISEPKAVGIDIEHWDKDTYLGYICLLQFILPSGDVYLVDTLALEIDSLKMMKSFFENPNIIKILYGSDSDLMWLQKDFGIFVVNLFDIKIAADMVDKKKDNSLAGLIKRRLGIEVDFSNKHAMQQSNWSQRPLTNEQIEYAIQDCRYLIQLHANLSQELLQKFTGDDLRSFNAVMQERCLKTHKAPHPLSEERIKLEFDKVVKEDQKFHSQSRTESHQSTQVWGCFNSLMKARDIIAKKYNFNRDVVLGASPIFQLIIDTDTKKVELALGELAKEGMIEQAQIGHIVQDLIAIKLKPLPANQEIPKQFVSDKQKKKYEEKMARREKMLEKIVRQKPVYENCTLLTPDGQILSYISLSFV